MSVAPHNEQRIVAPFANVVVDGVCVSTGVFDLNFFGWSFWIVKPNEEYTLTWLNYTKKKRFF